MFSILNNKNKNQEIEILKTDKKSLLDKYEYKCFFKYDNNNYLFNLKKYKNSNCYDLEVNKIQLFEDYRYNYLKNVYEEYKLKEEANISKKRNYLEFDETFMKKLQNIGLINQEYKIQDIEIKNSLYYYQDLFKNEKNTDFIECTLNEDINYNEYNSFDKYFVKNNGNEYFMHHKTQSRKQSENEIFEIEKLNSNNKNLENLSIVINKQIESDKLVNLMLYFEIGNENLSGFNKAAIDEYKDIIKLIGDKFNYPFDVNIGNCIFDFKEKDINLSINKCTNGFETNYYKIKTDKNNAEIIKEDNPHKLIYSCNKKNIVGTNIEIRKADKNEFSEYLFTLLNRMNQKYNFMEFDYKDYNQFKENVESIDNSQRKEQIINER
nr:MAG TPA: hypothetical protein [Caudoviricetes sp.]